MSIRGLERFMAGIVTVVHGGNYAGAGNLEPNQIVRLGNFDAGGIYNY